MLVVLPSGERNDPPLVKTFLSFMVPISDVMSEIDDPQALSGCRLLVQRDSLRKVPP